MRINFISCLYLLLLLPVIWTFLQAPPLYAPQNSIRTVQILPWVRRHSNSIILVFEPEQFKTISSNLPSMYSKWIHLNWSAPFGVPFTDFLVEKDNNYCVCQTPCNMTRYGKELSMVKIPSKASAKYLAKKFNKSEQYIGYEISQFHIEGPRRTWNSSFQLLHIFIL